MKILKERIIYNKMYKDYNNVGMYIIVYDYNKVYISLHNMLKQRQIIKVKLINK